MAHTGFSAEEQIDVISPDGTRLAVWRSGVGPALVLVHGTTVNHADWAPVMPALRQHFTLHAIDRRGSGASGDNPEYALHREFEDVAAVVDSVSEPAFLLGHSFGALCSLEAALRTSNIRKMVLYEPPIPIPDGPEFHPPRLRERLQALMASGRPEDVVATFLEEVARQDPRRVQLQRRVPGWASRIAAAHTVVRDVSSAQEYELPLERLRELRMPVLMLLGGDSPDKHVVPTTLIAKTLPNAQLVVLPGQTHIAMHAATELFVGEVLRFLLER